MKEAIVHVGPRVEVIDSPMPIPGPDQVVIKVMYSGSNPKDWKAPERWYSNKAMNHGDDIAGLVHAVGENITEFHPGDRVAAFHEMGTAHGSFAEYAVSWGFTTFHLPKSTSLEEASTIPLASMTAAVSLYMHLGLPEPWLPTSEPLPLVIYGGSSATGSFAIKLASLSNIHPIIVVAGRAQEYVEGLIDRSKGDAIIDYRRGEKAVVTDIRKALSQAGHDRVYVAFDAVSEKGSSQNLAKVLEPTGTMAVLLPGNNDGIPPSLKKIFSTVGVVHGAAEWKPTDKSAQTHAQAQAGARNPGKDFGSVFFRFFARALDQGIFSGHPYQVVPGGLDGIEEGLSRLKAGQASAFKYIFRISDTKGVGAGPVE